ncbi:MAG: hypothetical protein LAT84_02845 [Balneolia bacterium]|nr:hypothetical protein [Balneolia bacterium]
MAYKIIALSLLICCCISGFSMDASAAAEEGAISTERVMASADSLAEKSAGDMERDESSNTIVLFQWNSILPFSSWIYQQAAGGQQALYRNTRKSEYTVKQNGDQNTSVIINLGGISSDKENDKQNQATIRQSGSGNSATIIQN